MQKYLKNSVIQLFITLGVFGVIGGVFAWTAPSASPTGGAGALQVSGGNIGIGKNPTVKLDVNGTTKAVAFIGDGSGLTNLPSGAIPSGMIAMFDAACPSGWTEFTQARGRYIIGLQPGGSLSGTVGAALSDLENRPAGAHKHYAGLFVHRNSSGSGSNALFPADYGSGYDRFTVDTKTLGGVSVPDGTNAPYIQLLICKKD